MKTRVLLIAFTVQAVISSAIGTKAYASPPVDPTAIVQNSCLITLASIPEAFHATPIDFMKGLVASFDMVPLTADNFIFGYLKGLHVWADSGWFSLPQQSVMDFTGERKFQPHPNDLAFLRNAKKKGFVVTRDTAFKGTVEAAARMPREHKNWITPLYIQVYQELFERKVAHSFEVWRDGRLVAGLFGIMVGNVFRIQSMFHLVDQKGKTLKIANNAGKLALNDCILWQINQGLTFMDIAEGTSKLMRAWGAYKINRDEFSQRIKKAQGVQ
jgi:leucyl/phenylalanyl-tRNA--protein transferase